MPITGYDHVALTVVDLEATCAFYAELFGAETHLEYAPAGKPLVRQIKLGGAMLSVLQQGHGIALQAKQLVPGAIDICFRWSQPIESAVALLARHNIPIIDGPSPRKFSDGRDSASVYFRDPDGNLVELMAPAGGSTSITGIDHIAITCNDLNATIAFYDKLFGARKVFAYAPNGKPLTTQILVGDALLSLHQYGNGIELVARKPTPGSQDYCLRWDQPIDTVAALLAQHNIPIADGPSPRRRSDTNRPAKSIYFYDPDGNIVELMAHD